jgi:hypothetical protein
VRKSRNSSSGLYRCRRRSAYDRRRTNAMRFLMNTLLAHPIPRLIHAFRQNPLWIRSGCAAVFVSPAKPRSRHPRSLAWYNYSSQSFGASSILLSKLLAWQYTHLNPSLPSSAPRRAHYFSQTLNLSRLGLIVERSHSATPSSRRKSSFFSSARIALELFAAARSPSQASGVRSSSSPRTRS